MDRESFEKLVAQAVDDLPDEFRERLENVDIVVEDYPAPAQMRRMGLGRDKILLGLYEGVPQTERGGHYGLVPPDKITIFKRSIEAKCRYGGNISAEVQRVVKHEIAHHFGISDARLHQLEKEDY
jgi:predicted Zn-dependent protease with MMP-like domain